ncbi:two-component system, NarL family, sensor histidine kinase DesK [Amycolatopsis pretoriensis]|uniref:Two-component system, NarL family, sensor histidine kinase DesK n=1 Tax=Amycolatopsis pretoriensis TaxID=218821 RepID=A0A1H5QBU2_9PSEU|nr:histidine kinase [Amycolatopsis pretoriensis]SEF23526.1 two-component system, NarL family, sensor histidine kinase DesK [Amycolatopsis pretoriensis]
MSERDPSRFSVRQWPDWSFWENRRRRVAPIVVNGLALLVLLPRITTIGHGGHGTALTVVALTAIGLYAGCYLFALWFAPPAPRRQRVVIVAALFAFGVTPALLFGSPDYLTDLTFAIAIGLMLLPLRYSVPLGFATAAGQLAWMKAGTGHVSWSQVAALGGVTAAVGVVFALTFTVGHLEAARAQIRRMAVDAERERVARELHDILGHNLSTMAVKLGLARRVLESAADPGLALAEVRDLETLCHQSLSDVRATVSGYREVSLATELSGARLALRAAGVQVELPASVDEVEPGLQGVFGYVVREAVTNVLRHSDAGQCRVRVGPGWVEVTDDGTVTGEPAPGHGLTGLAERLAAVSGRLEHGRGPRGGYRVFARAEAVPA